jgi:hypothetical protein
LKGKNLREMQEDYKETVVGLCLVCSRSCGGWYGRYQDTGVCSKKCMLEYDKREKFPEHPAEAFEKLHGL